jgi:hypothetical protein
MSRGNMGFSQMGLQRIVFQYTGGRHAGDLCVQALGLVDDVAGGYRVAANWVKHARDRVCREFDVQPNLVHHVLE